MYLGEKDKNVAKRNEHLITSQNDRIGTGEKKHYRDCRGGKRVRGRESRRRTGGSGEEMEKGGKSGCYLSENEFWGEPAPVTLRDNF